MADPVQTPPATPPVNDPNGGNVPPATPPAQPGISPAPAPIIMNQEQFDQRYGEKLTALERELGLEPGAFKDPAGLKARIATQKKPPATPAGETLSGADLKIARMEALMTAGIPSKQIPLLLQHLNISGKTREEIQASVGQLIDLKLLTIEAPAAPGNQQQPNQPPNAAQGAGNLGVPGNPGKKTWKKSEIEAMTNEQIIANEAEIDKAQKEGRIDYHL